MSRRIVIATYLVAAAGLLVGLSGTSSATARETTGRTGPVWTTIIAGESHTCGIRLDQTLWCWGSNGAGQLGLGDVEGPRTTPTRVGTDTSWAHLGAGSAYTCAIRTDHTLWCWGANDFGQLGLGNRETRYFTPTQVGIGTDWAKVSLGYHHTCATRTDHTLWCWGNNAWSQLGLGDKKHRKVPTQVGTSADWAHVIAGDSYHAHTCATRTDNTLWCWGRNDSGQLGLGDNKLRSTPTRVGTDSDWAHLSAGNGHTCATRTNHTLWCWGDNNYYGQLGLGDTIDRMNPTQVGADSNWAYLSLGADSSCATRTDHSLWCWGDNYLGMLGLGQSRHHRTTPTQVGTDTRWALIRLGGTHTCATRTNHTLWCWGWNAQGQLGLGHLKDRRVPTRV